VSLLLTRFALAGLLLIPGVACSARQSAGERADPSVITQTQIRENGFRTAWEAVETLRSRWLLVRPDGLGQEREVIVYLDDIRLGGSSQAGLSSRSS
jgi:hypothetical protein